MIIWLNGPFGAGKTTLAEKLRVRKPDLLLFDPEEVGFLVRKLLPPAESVDYQDLPVWRGLTATALAEIRKHYSQDIIVPMTLVRPDYLDELIGGLIRRGEDVLHVFLTLDERVLRDRIERQAMSPDRTRNEQIRDWRLAQVDRCLSARDLMPDGTRFLDTGLHTADVLADRILEWLGAMRTEPSR
jgi:hypothetical protein